MRNILGHNTNKSLSFAYGDKIHVVCTGHQLFWLPILIRYSCIASWRTVEQRISRAFSELCLHYSSERRRFCIPVALSLVP